MTRRNDYMIIFGAVLSAMVGAIACSGPFLWASLVKPGSWGIDIGMLAFMLLMGAIIGGYCAVALAQMGGRVGRSVNKESGKTVGIALGILAGVVIGGGGLRTRHSRDGNFSLTSMNMKMTSRAFLKKVYQSGRSSRAS